MDVIRFAISRPVSVAVGVILVVFFGLIGARSLPIQLSPNVDRPIITVTTNWQGRSPQEIVDEITKEQEERLKNVANLKKMQSLSSEGQATVTLEFYLGTDLDRALQEVSDALRQVPDYPEDVDEPTIKAAGGGPENAIAWIIVSLDPAAVGKHPDFDITTLYDALDKEVKPYIERIDGVAEVNIYGGREREMRVLVDPTRLAQRGLTYGDLIEALRSENRNVSAGTIAEGKRDYRVRVVGQYASAQDLRDTVIMFREGTPVYVRDVAEVELSYVKPRGFVRTMGQPAVAINAIRQAGSNVMSIMDELNLRLEEIRKEVLPNLHAAAGPDLRINQVYDETVYIRSAVDLVTQNLWIGGLIAGFVLLLFLRSFVATGVIAVAIPISVVGTFLILVVLGRSLNVISLAGLAFAVGMVVDNAIVVLENIDRHLKMHKPPLKAAYEGGREVWGAVLASTLTTIAVFVPVLTIQEEAGQLFRDISIAIVASVALSLIVSITVIPAATARFLRPHGARKGLLGAIDSLFGIAPLVAAITRSLNGMVYWLMTGWRGWSLRPLVIVGLMAGSLLGAAALMPPMDYLPAGNRNLVFGGLLIPPGYSVEQRETIAGRIEQSLRPYVEADLKERASVAALPPIPRRAGEPPFDPVPVERFFIGSFGSSMFIGATSQDEQVVLPIAQLVTNSMSSIPDTYGGAAQSSLFGRGIGGGSSIDVEISGPSIARVTAAAEHLFRRLGTHSSRPSGEPDFGYTSLRADPPNFQLQQQEFQARVNRTGTELGLRAGDIGVAAQALFDGAFAGDFRTGADTIDIRVLPRGGRLAQTQDLADVPIATPAGPVVPIESVVTVVPALAPQEVRRIEELPAVTIGIRPPADRPLEELMTLIDREYIAKAREAGLIDRTMRVRLEGSAAQLDEVRTSLLGPKPTLGAPSGPAQKAGYAIGGVLLAAGLGVGVFAVVRASAPRLGAERRRRLFYGAVGAALLGAVLAGVFLMFSANPQFITARFIWALFVTYLLMCALFESFLYPLVIMFTVPLALVGGFAGLKIVHEWTAANPTIADQNLDVLTMLGFIILIGVVVNNAILIVEQSLNFMNPARAGGEGEGLPPLRAIAEAMSSRVRPVFMSTLTSVGGMLPLVIAPGAGSELYRGLGAVVVGGLLCSTIFTLLLVPLTFSLTLQMADGLRAAFRRGGEPPAAPPPKRSIPGSAAEPVPVGANGDGWSGTEPQPV